MTQPFKGTQAELAEYLTKVGDDKVSGNPLLPLWSSGYRSACLDIAALVRTAIIEETTP